MTCNLRIVFNRRLLLLTVLSSSLATGAFAGGSGVSSIAEREIARRMARMEDARQAIEKGDKLYAEGDYEAALGEYRSALDALPNAPLTQEWRDLAAAKYADCSVMLARERAKNGRYKEAHELLDGALAINPDHKDAKKFKEQLDDPDRYPPALTPEHVTKVQEVERGLQMANSNADLGNYDKALTDFQDVLRKDGYNKAARRGMERVEEARSEYFDTARDHQRARMLNMVNEAWEDKVPVAALNIEAQYGAGKDTTRYISEKMQMIVFPKVQFSGASIEEAIEYLRVKSKDLDELEKDPAKKGVNIILKAGDTPITSQITLDLNDVPMVEALRYITELAGMKFKVEAHAVVVVPISDVSSEQYTRIYKVPPDFLSIGGGDAGGGGAAAAPADPFAAQPAGGGGGTSLIKRKSALEILKEQGIPFPEGATAVFNPVTSQLIVKNTQPNLDLVETFVDSIIGNTPKMIYITTKFVEVTQKNTEELGFDWLLGGFSFPGSDRVFGSGGTVGNGQRTEVGVSDYPLSFPGASIPIGQNPMTFGNRTGTAAISNNAIDGLLAGASPLSTAAPGVMAFAGVFTDPQFQVVLRALNQKKGVDLMSAPSVTTKSGQRATVEVVREFIYPTEFDPPEIPQQFGNTGVTTVGNSGFGQAGGAFPVTPTTPTAFEMRPVGVRMEVDPVLGADGYTIDLNLAPEVTEFEGFINYGSPINTTGTNALGNPVQIVLTDNKIEQPVFSSRKVQTAVTIWDGQTVAMGGLIREDVQDVEDKVPVLGDIPILGRLFQSKAEDHFKRNLMVFVTAKLIDPSGQEIKRTQATTEPAALPTDLGGPNPLLPPAGGQ